MALTTQWELTESEALAALEAENLDEVLEIIMNGYGTALYRFCLRIVHNEAIAEDVLQTTFVQAYQGLPAFERRSTLRSWLFGIARHRALDTLKIDRRREARIRPVEVVPEVAADRQFGADEGTTQRELRNAMSNCLHEFSDTVRETLLLRFRDELTYPEISQVTGERAPTLQARVTRALPLLKQCLQKKGILHV